jgi:DNA replication protein DnaC
MSAAQLERLQEQMQRLRLFKSRERLEALLQDATTKEASYAGFLDTLLTEEVASKTAKHVTMRTHLARFPFVKSLDTFDFSYQPSLDKKQIETHSGDSSWHRRTSLGPDGQYRTRSLPHDLFRHTP